MDFSLLPVFIAITEQGSLTKAAEYLHMTKSAVSKKLAALETQTGIRLVTRTTRHLQLTEAGQLYYTYLKKPIRPCWMDRMRCRITVVKLTAH